MWIVDDLSGARQWSSSPSHHLALCGPLRCGEEGHLLRVKLFHRGEARSRALKVAKKSRTTSGCWMWGSRTTRSAVSWTKPIGSTA